MSKKKRRKKNQQWCFIIIWYVRDYRVYKKATLSIACGIFRDKKAKPKRRQYTSRNTNEKLSCEILKVVPDVCGSQTKKLHAILSYQGKSYPMKKDLQFWLIIKKENLEACTQIGIYFLVSIQDLTAKKLKNLEERESIDDPKDVKPEGCVSIPAKVPARKLKSLTGMTKKMKIKNPNYKGGFEDDPDLNVINPIYHVGIEAEKQAFEEAEKVRGAREEEVIKVYR
ncbi:hypothetical protein C5167_003785 [Papaver somniferum]|uniref:Uncharacterized protein n=1 Tax=Papaver somniferum TaxID=3469 RepID=A0A4Y7L4L3_PAPSO|nr:hypothetical protein C5167_003785 [Papaver somniferum]